MRSHGDQLRALVDQLVEAVLAVRARLAPVDGARLVVDRPPVERDAACRSTPSSAAGGRRGSARGTGRTAARATVWAPKKSRVPDREQAHQHRQVLARTAPCGSARPSRGSRRAARAKPLGADREHRREADRRVHRVAAADPVPEAEHVRRCRCRTPRPPRRSSRRRRSAARPRPRRRRAPSSSQSRAVVRVRHRLERRERLRGDDEERLGGVEVARRLGEVGRRRRSRRSGTSGRGGCSGAAPRRPSPGRGRSRRCRC